MDLMLQQGAFGPLAATAAPAPCTSVLLPSQLLDPLPCLVLQDAPVCWICLDGSQAESKLVKPCQCPRLAHSVCLGRWNLQMAGTR